MPARMFEFFSPTLELPRRFRASAVTLCALGFFVVGWSVFWAVSWWRVRSALDDLQQIRPGQPLSLVCGEREIGGYPLRIVARCADPLVTIAQGPKTSAIKLKQLTFSSYIYAAPLVSIDAAGPMQISDSASSAIADAAWNSLNVTTRGALPNFARVSIVGTGLTLNCAKCGYAGGLLDVPLTVAAFQTHVKRAPGSARDYDIAVSYAGIASPRLDDASGNGDPANLVAIGTMAQGLSFIEGGMASSGQIGGALERWRIAGGRLNLDALSLHKGALSVDLNGTFGLDQGRRLDGGFEIKAETPMSLLTGLASFLAPPVQIAATLLLQQFGAGGGVAKPHFAGTVENGSVSIGPFRGVLTLPPLY